MQRRKIDMSGTDFHIESDGVDRLKIAMVAPPYFDIPPKGYGGIEAVVADLADALVGRGHDVTLLGAGEPGTAARFVPLWDRTVPARLGEPYPEVMHALRVRREIARIAETEGVDFVHDHTFAGPPQCTRLQGARAAHCGHRARVPIDDDLYQYYRELGDEVGLMAISDRQRELASELNWVGRVL
jgi:hypothetical protein